MTTDRNAASNESLVTSGQKKMSRTPSQRLAAMFNVEVDSGSDLGSLCSLYPLNRDQSGERNEEQRISETTEHVFFVSQNF